MRKEWVLLGICLALMLLLIPTITAIDLQNIINEYTPPHTRPGPASESIIFKSVSLDIAPAALEAGEIDAYLFGLRSTVAAELVGKPTISLINAPSGLYSIVINPAPPPEGQLNPLSIPEVRIALQYIVNRDYISKEIFRGFASPMITFLSAYDPDYITIFDIVKKYEFRYDPEYAMKLVRDAMTKAGAVMKEGKWYYKDQPITLKFIIRIEDERRQIGDSVATDLERLGFQVERLYHPFGVAIEKVYLTDPKDFEWHLYTEAWGKGAPEKYDSSTINQMCAPWFGYMPGWQDPAYWNYVNEELDDIGMKISVGEFQDLETRNKLYRRATEICIQESIRLWVATRLDAYGFNPNMKGVTNDIGTGLRGTWNPREVWIPGKDTLVFGHLWVWTETTTWNWVGGFQDVYSVDIRKATYDSPVYRHPFMGPPIPFRASYKVETEGPFGKLILPEGAYTWSAKEDRWVSVAGKEATSKVTWDLSKYFKSKWHHGQPITIADLLYFIASMIENTYDEERSTIESAIAETVKVTLDKFVGLRIVDQNTVEIYVNYWHFDPNYIAEFASPLGVDYSMYYSETPPWELMAAMNELVFVKKQAAYGQTTAEKLGIPWLSVVLKDHAEMIKNVLEEFAGRGYFPENYFKVGDKIYSSRDEALARYRAAISWFNEHGHMQISNGPFYLNRFDSAAQYAELKAFRDATYPFKPGDWYFGIPERVEIIDVKVKDVTAGDEALFTVDLSGPGTLEAKYLVVNPATGQILASGEAEKVTPTRFEIRLSKGFTWEIGPGTYNLVIGGYSDQVAFVAEGVESFKVLERRVEAVETVYVTQTVTPPTVTTTVTTIPVEAIGVFAVILIVAVALTTILSRRLKKTQ
ncbi:MAG: ABC transporter substrate-binding protein [Aigarchaeota archaeon]|nr:ABC transporter substrate-binding protein [Aigarchaeota archaeon]MCX8192710.1 ABC transporter substrate-binding protein [Nitrososphaeria archaeon]MDW7985962.1 ABC transporter substrate-binding protein [Nitrososphaerota archaeon]